MGPRGGLDVLQKTKICRPYLDQKAGGDVEKLLKVVMEGCIFRDDSMVPSCAGAGFNKQHNSKQTDGDLPSEFGGQWEGQDHNTNRFMSIYIHTFTTL